MSEISVRDLRNDGGRVLDRVEQGEVLVVTRNRRPVAELRPLRGEAHTVQMVLERWKGIPSVDLSALRADIDAVMETELK